MGQTVPAGGNPSQPSSIATIPFALIELPIGEHYRLPPLIAPGVRGFIHRVDGMTFVPLIEAERPGSGDVGRWLDALRGPTAFVEVGSPRLVGMLLRRGYVAAKMTVTFDHGYLEDADVMWKPAR